MYTTISSGVFGSLRFLSTQMEEKAFQENNTKGKLSDPQTFGKTR